MLVMLITVAVILLIAYGCFWLVDSMGLPHPVNMIAKVVVGLLALYAILQKTGLLAGL